MARLTDPHTGSTVDVEDDFAKVLTESFGYKPAADAETRKTPVKKSASSRSHD